MATIDLYSSISQPFTQKFNCSLSIYNVPKDLQGKFPREPWSEYDPSGRSGNAPCWATAQNLTLEELSAFITRAQQILIELVGLKDVTFPERLTQTYTFDDYHALHKMIWFWQDRQNKHYYVIQDAVGQLKIWTFDYEEELPVLMSFVDLIKHLKKLESDIEILSQ